MLPGYKLYQLSVKCSFNSRWHLLNTIELQRGVASLARPMVELNENVLKSLENEEFKPRKHPGIVNSKTTPLPDDIIKAMVRATKDYPLKTILNEGAAFSRFLKSRHPPIEEQELRNKASQLRENYIAKKGLNFRQMDEVERNQKERVVMGNVQQALKKQVYNWNPIQYDEFKALQYMMVRSAPEYAVLFRIFSEIKLRDADFKPKGFFDFGSGIGTAIWAVTNTWNKDDVFEYFLCDSSKHMNDLSELILRGGDNNKQLDFKNINYRQFLPASEDFKYDLVVSAYSLFELNSREARLKVIKTLWEKCENYLVLVEQGTNAGFKLIHEAREFMLEMNADSATVFAPCPHESDCPRLLLEDGTPCNFQVTYTTTGIGGHVLNQKELFTYIVFKRRSGPKTDEEEWPRLVRPVLVRKKHSVCRMCTKNGKIEEVVFTASKHGKLTYHCARSSEWGDRLPMIVKPREPESEHN